MKKEKRSKRKESFEREEQEIEGIKYDNIRQKNRRRKAVMETLRKLFNDKAMEESNRKNETIVNSKQRKLNGTDDDNKQQNSPPPKKLRNLFYEGKRTFTAKIFHKKITLQSHRENQYSTKVDCYHDNQKTSTINKEFHKAIKSRYLQRNQISKKTRFYNDGMKTLIDNRPHNMRTNQKKFIKRKKKLCFHGIYINIHAEKVEIEFWENFQEYTWRPPQIESYKTGKMFLEIYDLIRMKMFGDSKRTKRQKPQKIRKRTLVPHFVGKNQKQNSLQSNTRLSDKRWSLLELTSMKSPEGYYIVSKEHCVYIRN